ncbi:MAG: hypothetical protein JO043_12660, partial [Candidatus Eremiobacteraeota bacterium]|nr:hypothetical protein [Candidatus Eremiobacteraeota bacterium]
MTDFLSMLESIAHGVFDAALISLGAFAVAVFVGVIPGVSLALRHRAWSLATILPLFALCSVLSGEFLYHEATGPTTYHLGPISDPFDLTLQKASRPLVTSAALRASPERLLGHAPTIHSFVALSSFLSLGAAIWALVALCSVAWLFWCFVGDIAVARTARRRDPLVSEEARSVRVGVRVSDDIDIPAALGLG